MNRSNSTYCLAECLLELRKQQNKKQTEAAEGMGVYIRVYQRYEYGEREPAASVLAAIADFYGVSMDYLMGRTENPAVNR